ncbi:MAG: ornithine cyclodeaminase family protein [Pseudomonadales bacterium]|jgi:ornithine cyclodeaminase|nr:ornithine cyclodeaminase family protein [Pseudomonadales bacterium]
MATPEFLDARALEQRLPYGALIEALADAFQTDVAAPPRLHGDLGVLSAGGEARDLLVMPAWEPGGAAGVKLVTLFEHNGRRHRPRIQGLYVLFHPEHGTPVAVLDAATLTTRRKAAASALAARHLARPDVEELLVLGTGRLARALPRAHACVRSFKRVRVWGRRSEAVDQAVADIAGALPRIDVDVAPDLQRAVARADLITSAIPSLDPVIQGTWLQPGQHVDLIGSYRPDMHEVDALALQRASLFVDTREGVLAEAGEFIDALANGTITERDLLADLAALTAGLHPGRTGPDEITLFKSVGTALEDLAAAKLAVARG